MRNVAIVANQDVCCGLAEHARGLAGALRKSMDVDEFPADVSGCSGYDVVFLNQQSGSFEISMEVMQWLRSNNKKVVVIVNDAGPTVKITPNHYLSQANAIVAHGALTLTGEPAVPVSVIEVGVSDVDSLPEFNLEDGASVGTAGFPFPSKRMDLTITAARRIGGKAVIIAPPNRFHDPQGLYAEWKRMGTGCLNLITDWLPQNEVVRTLARCALCLYFPDEFEPIGQSGSVRMILAAGRPTIVRRVSKASGLAAYEDEIYFVNTEHEATAMTEAIWNALREGKSVKRPNRVRQATSWTTVGQRYLKLINELVG